MAASCRLVAGKALKNAKFPIGQRLDHPVNIRRMGGRKAFTLLKNRFG